MGGKHKQAQRTKNNARPSSSGRAAELLGSNLPQFSAFSCTKELSLPLTNFGISEDVDAVDTNFQLVFKKMNKKDATTKLKALQEFSDLVKSSEPDAVVAVLPFWPRLYCILATDAEHRVREAVHLAHHQVVLKVKRNIAPFLKQLVGAWFTSQYDTYAPAAYAAKLSFESAFPANKLQEAIIFCQEEILNYINENLNVHSAQSVGNTKTASPEELEAKYERIVISSLQGYTLYLNKVNKEAVEKTKELNESLVLNSKFWKLPKHSVAPIRSAWFETISVVCSKAPFLLEKLHSQLTSVVFNSLAENEPTVLPRVWEAVLLTITTVPEWSTYINIEKVFIPKLWKILREGGQGSAVVIYRNLLPLISNLPQTIDANTFYSSYFENMRIGLKHKTVLSSRSESSAIATSFVECLQYIIMKNQSDVALCEKLIKTQLMPLLEWSLIETQATPKIIYTQITTLVHYWNRNQSKPDMLNYAKYLQYFWSNISSLFQGLLMNYEFKHEIDGVSDLADRQVEFLLSLKQLPKSKKQLRVSFEAVEASGDRDRIEGVFELDGNYMEALNKFVYEVCEAYVKFINAKQCKELIGHLVTLVQEYDGELFFNNMQKQVSKENSTLLEVYKSLFSKWLKSNYLTSKHVVDLVFLLMMRLNDVDKKYILNEINQLTDQVAFSDCISQALSHPYNTNNSIIEWLHGEKVSSFLVNIVKEDILENNSHVQINILKQSLNENESGDMFIAQNALQEIVNELSKCLSDVKNYDKINLDECVSLSSHIASIIYSEKFVKTFGDDLLLSLLTLTCNIKSESEVLSEDTLWEACTAWQDVISMFSLEMSKEEFMEISTKCANIIENLIYANPWKESVYSNAIEKTTEFLKCCKHLTQDVMQIFVERSFILELRNFLTAVCSYSEFIFGNLSCLSTDQSFKLIQDIDMKVLDNKIEKYFIWRNFVNGVLLQQFDEEEDENNEDNIKVIYVYESSVDGTKMLLDIIYDFALLEVLTKVYTNSKHYKDICNITTNIKKDFLTKIENVDILEGDLSVKIFSENWLWTKSSKILNELRNENMKAAFNKIINANKDETNLGKLHLIQTYQDQLTYEDVTYNFGSIEKIIVLRCMMHSEELDIPIAETFNVIAKLKNGDMRQTFHEIDFTKLDQVVTITEIINFFARYIKLKNFEEIPAQQWDFIVISLASWTSGFEKIKSNYKNVYVTAFVVATLDLFCNVTQCIKNISQESTKKNRINEWEDVFEQSVHSEIVKLWYFLSGEFTKSSERYIEHIALLKTFIRVLPNLDSKYIFEKAVDGAPKWSKILKTCLPLLINSNSYLQIWGYRMLVTMTSGFMNVDSQSVTMNTPHEKGLILAQFKDILLKTQDIVQAMLIDIKLGENSCRVKPFTDSYTYTFGYFMLWDVLISIFEKASTDLNYQYSDWLKKESLLENMLNNVFKLLPAEVLNQVRSKKLLENFSNRPKLNGNTPHTSELLEHLVCWVYSFALLNLPASVRQWWTNSDTKTCQIIERVTSDYLSLYLCNQELSAVEQHENNFKNMSIKVLKSIRTVKATYTVDESQMELQITLPLNYPLGGPDVECNNLAGTSHKQWLMQLKMCVLHQNGRIWDGLSLWNHNLDKKFDGVEECYICFAVLHPGTYQLPKLSCKTCRKKFHSACLYKWFSTSNKSTCPICRNLF